MIDRTAEDIAQDKRLAQLANKIDELAVSLDQIERRIEALSSPMLTVVGVIGRVETAIKKIASHFESK